MVDRIHSGKVPKLYIREWMQHRGYDQKRLAQIMEVGEGTVSKKLAKPERIDAEWLARFADALNVEVTELFRDPAAPTARELLSGANEVQKKQILDYADYVLRRTGNDTQ